MLLVANQLVIPMTRVWTLRSSLSKTLRTAGAEPRDAAETHLKHMTRCAGAGPGSSPKAGLTSTDLLIVDQKYSCC